MGPGHRTDAELVELARAGDDVAWADLYRRHAPATQTAAFLRLRDQHRAADVTSQTWLLAWTRLDQLREPAAFKGWVAQIGRNVATDVIRRAKPSESDEILSLLPADQPDPGEPAAGNEAARLLWDAAEVLTDRDRQVLAYHLRLGLTSAELADVLDVSPAHASVLVNRATERIEKAVAMLVLTRHGRAGCEELAALLVDWDGRWTSAIRTKVQRHETQCETCQKKRKVLTTSVGTSWASTSEQQAAAAQGIDVPGPPAPDLNPVIELSDEAGTVRSVRRRAVLQVVTFALLVAGWSTALAVTPDAADAPNLTIVSAPIEPPATTAQPLPTVLAGEVVVAPPSTTTLVPPDFGAGLAEAISATLVTTPPESARTAATVPVTTIPPSPSTTTTTPATIAAPPSTSPPVTTTPSTSVPAAPTTTAAPPTTTAAPTSTVTPTTTVAPPTTAVPTTTLPLPPPVATPTPTTTAAPTTTTTTTAPTTTTTTTTAPTTTTTTTTTTTVPPVAPDLSAPTFGAWGQEPLIYAATGACAAGVDPAVPTQGVITVFVFDDDPNVSVAANWDGTWFAVRPPAATKPHAIAVGPVPIKGVVTVSVRATDTAGNQGTAARSITVFSCPL
ncbi:MAG: sigma-70 family RNA polymerase sigma factor [Actinomycetota bacterium]